MVIHRDLRRVARIRAVANAIVGAFERNQQLLRCGKARKGTIVGVNFSALFGVPVR
jgi:hypothetical protein